MENGNGIRQIEEPDSFIVAEPDLSCALHLCNRNRKQVILLSRSIRPQDEEEVK